MTIRRSVSFSFIDKYATAAIGIVMIVVVARLLTPAEVGVFMVGLATVNVVEHFREFGIGNYLVQARDITPEAVRTAFTLTLGLSVLLAALLNAMAGLLARFYDHPELGSVLQVLAACFLFVPFSSPIIALMRREMEFRTIAVINIVATAAGAAATIAFAWFGFSSLSLALGALVAAAGTAAMALALRPGLVSFRPAVAEWRRVISFGGYSSATTLLNTLYELLPPMVVGRVLGFDAAGVYSSASRLCQLPERWMFGALQPVVLPALSARARAGDDLKEPYLGALGLITAVQWPFLVCLALLADPLVDLLLGTQWAGVAPLVRIIAVAWLSMFPAMLTYPLLVSVGRVQDTLKASLIGLVPSSAVMIGATFLGLKALAASYLLTAPFQVCVVLVFVRRQIHFTWRELADAVSKSAVVTLCAGAAPAAAVILSGFRFDLSIGEMMLAGSGAVLGWLVGMSLTAHPLLDELQRAAAVARRSIAEMAVLRGRG